MYAHWFSENLRSSMILAICTHFMTVRIPPHSIEPDDRTSASFRWNHHCEWWSLQCFEWVIAALIRKNRRWCVWPYFGSSTAPLCRPPNFASFSLSMVEIGWRWRDFNLRSYWMSVRMFFTAKCLPKWSFKEAAGGGRVESRTLPWGTISCQRFLRKCSGNRLELSKNCDAEALGRRPPR